jgi:NADH-quinone oxidoreductase subunit H
MFFIIFLIQILIVIISLLIPVAYFTLAERKILGAAQRRRGPNVIGIYGLLQPLSDGFKLLVKETVLPSNSNKYLFILSPMITFFLSLMSWVIIPYNEHSFLADMNIGIIYLFAISSLSIYGIIMAGWSSNSKYAFLGALRSTSQMVSYEVSIGFVLLTVVVSVGSYDLSSIINSQKSCWNLITFFPLFLLFFISALAETNRHPFDLPEAEAELVSGYNVEYGAMGFALFSLGEYANMLTMSALCSILFFGGWLSPLSILSFISGSIWFGLKICFFVLLYVLMRAILPRYRYDQLMDLGWKYFLPISICYLITTSTLILSFNLLPF